MNPANRQDTQNAPHTGLARVLGPRIATAIVVGTVIGSGIFFKPGTIAANVGDFRTIIGVWLFGGLLCLLGALCFSELATMFPEAGGIYVYLRESYGRLTAFLFGWCEFLFSKPASIGALAVAFVGSLSLVVSDLDSNGEGLSSAMQVVVVAGLILGLAAINILGVIWGGRLQMAITVVKAANLALVAMLPVGFLIAGYPTMSLANFASRIEPQQTTLAAQVGTALLAVMWAYHGWHGITPMAEEIRDPQRNLPRAIFLGIGILIVLYVSANVAYHGALPMQSLADAADHGAERMLQQVLQTVFGPDGGQRGAAIMSAVIMCSTFGAINSNLLEAPRISFAMGRDRVFFNVLGRVHPEFRTPAIAIGVTAIMSVATVMLGAFGKFWAQDLIVSPDASHLTVKVLENLKQGSLFTLLTNFVVFVSNVFYALGVLAVMLLRRKMPHAVRPYRTWGYPYVPVLYLLISAWFLVQVFRSNPLESIAGVGLMAIGIPVYWLFQRSQH
ncbi:MAG: Serine/threonine exchanger SteT [Planctomycetota bacterium]|jgi:amino acid transporter